MFYSERGLQYLKEMSRIQILFLKKVLIHLTFAVVMLKPLKVSGFAFLSVYKIRNKVIKKVPKLSRIMMNLHVAIVAAKNEDGSVLVISLTCCKRVYHLIHGARRWRNGTEGDIHTMNPAWGWVGWVGWCGCPVSPCLSSTLFVLLLISSTLTRRMYIGSSLFDHFTGFGEQRCVCSCSAASLKNKKG